jgi:hypothetical protein
VAATFHVAGFDDKKGTTGLRVYPQHDRLWHMKTKGLHAIFYFVVNSESFMLRAL